MRYKLRTSIGFGLAILANMSADAGNGFEIVTYSVVGSTGTQESGEWNVFSAVGQPVVSGDVMGGGFSITSGFPPNSGGEAQCLADINDDGSLNFFDISEFISAFSEQLPIADFNEDGAYNFLDISTFISLYSMGCP